MVDITTQENHSQRKHLVPLIVPTMAIAGGSVGLKGKKSQWKIALYTLLQRESIDGDTAGV